MFMKKAKRIMIATIVGVLCGFVCLALASGGESEVPYAVKMQIIISRTLIGFAIGISSLKFNWALHGLFIGLLFSLPLAFSGLMAPDIEEFGVYTMFFSTIIMGMIYGFLIELITSFLLKAKIE